MNYKRAWAEINLANLVHNLTVVKSKIPSNSAVEGKTSSMLCTEGISKIMAIVKADGYGHGAVSVAHALSAGGVRSFGVAICEEGIELRQSGITAPILIMGFTPEPLLMYALELNLTQTIFSADGAKILASHAASYEKRAAIHIKIDTGMSRLGFLPDKESISAICEIAENPNLFIEGIYTHFATSDALDSGFMFEQITRFKWVLNGLEQRGLKIPIKHMANSGAFAQSLRNFNETVGALPPHPSRALRALALSHASRAGRVARCFAPPPSAGCTRRPAALRHRIRRTCPHFFY